MSQKVEVEADVIQAGKETGPLSWEQLSKNECDAIYEIEDRLKEVQQQAEQSLENEDKTQVPDAEEDFPLAKPQQFYERVFLIDGGRGTGKSSLLQTLIQRWTDKKNSSRTLKYQNL